MNKLIGLSILGVMLTPTIVSCNEVDLYVPPQPYTIDWQAAADSTTNALVDYFWNPNGYFNETAKYDGRVDNGNGWNYWPQAHAMDVIIDAYERTNNSTYSAMFDKWYDGIKTQNDGGNTGGYTNDYYDDEAWIALTMTRLYKVTNDSKYLTVAQDLYNDIADGWNDEYAGGGVAWRKSMPWSKNACINGPAATLALKLYEVTNDNSYVDFAKKVYEWSRENLFVPGSGQVYDSLDGTSGEVTAWDFTYNQGTFMAAAYMLYQLTNEDLYLKDARRAAYYTISAGSFLDAANNLLKFENGGTPSGDSALFRAVFFHYYYDIVTSDDFEDAWHKKFLSCFECSTEYLWRNGVADKRYILFGPDWSAGPDMETDLNSMVSACAAIEMRAKYEAQKQN